MENYTIIKLNIENTILVLINTCESPFDYINEITTDLNKMSFSGIVIIDELLHSGNNSERFISCDFSNGRFMNNSFAYCAVGKQNVLRKYICEHLKEEYEYLELSGLTSHQIGLIKKDCVI